MRNLPVRLTKHSLERLKERFKLDRDAAQRFAERIVANGKIIYNLPSGIKIEHNGHANIFVISKDSRTSQEIILMITACNDDKSSEWIHYHHGERRNYTATKRSKINRGTAVNKCRDSKHHNLYYSEDDCA